MPKDFNYGEPLAAETEAEVALQRGLNRERELLDEIKALKHYIVQLRKRMTIREIVIEQAGKETRLVDVFAQHTDDGGQVVRIIL